MLRRVALAAAAPLAAAAVALYACGGPSEQRPVAAVASTPESGALFNQIRDAWQNPTHVTHAQLRALLDQFLEKYPKDGLVPYARALVACLAMEDRDYARAELELSKLQHLRPGTTADLATTARARWLRLHGQAPQAMRLLRPNIGKNVDPIARNLFQEELALTAMASSEEHEQYEAIAYMDAWLQGAGEEEREATRQKVAAIVTQITRDVLEAELRIMRAAPATSGYGSEMLRIVADRLAAIALAANDAELARTLLDPDAGALAVSGDAGL